MMPISSNHDALRLKGGHIEGLVIRPIPANVQFTGPGARCIEIVGVRGEERGSQKLQCLAVAPSLHDEFWKIAAMAGEG
jgi:hypothetical protein